MAGTEERVSEEVYKEDGYVYSLEGDGFIWKTPIKENPRGKRVKITTEEVKEESGFQYYINKEGYLVRKPLAKRRFPAPRTKRQTERKKSIPNDLGSIKELVSENKVLFSGIGIVIILLVLCIVIFASQLGSKNYQYNILQQSVKNMSQNISDLKNSNYLLRDNLSSFRNNYYVVEANNTNISNHYKALLYNISNPYVEMLATDKSIYLAGYVYVVQ